MTEPIIRARRSKSTTRSRARTASRSSRPRTCRLCPAKSSPCSDPRVQASPLCCACSPDLPSHRPARSTGTDSPSPARIQRLHRLPELRALSLADGAGKRRSAAEGARHGGAGAPRAQPAHSRHRRSGRLRGRLSPRSSPAACASVSALRARWWSSRKSSSWTSPSPRSTCSPRRTCAASCWSCGRRRPSRRSAIFLVTHNIEEAVLLADRIIVLGRNPGHVRMDFRVTLSQPRDRKSSLFTQLVDYIYTVLTRPDVQPRAVPRWSAGRASATSARCTTRCCPTRVPAASPACWKCLTRPQDGKDDIYNSPTNSAFEIDDLLPIVEAAAVARLPQAWKRATLPSRRAAASSRTRRF